MEALYSSSQLFSNTGRNANIQTNINNTRFNKFRDLNLGKQLPPPGDYLYNYNLQLYKYGKGEIPSKITGAPYGYPFVIRPPNDYVNGRYSQLLDHNLNREVDVAGTIYKNKDLPLPKPKLISV